MHASLVCAKGREEERVVVCRVWKVAKHRQLLLLLLMKCHTQLFMWKQKHADLCFVVNLRKGAKQRFGMLLLKYYKINISTSYCV